MLFHSVKWTQQHCASLILSHNLFVADHQKGYFITGGRLDTAVREGSQHRNQPLVVGHSSSAAFWIHVSGTAALLAAF